MIKIYDGFSKDKSYFLSSNGFGYLLEAFSASIILNLNAEFEFTFNYPINGINAKYIKNYNVVKSNMYGMDEQVFRINNVETVISEDGNYYIVSAAHITYDLNNNFLDDVYVKDKNGLNAMKWISEKAVDVHMFNLTSDLQKVSSARYIDKNIIEAIAGDIENSMKNRWGGDIYRDNFDLKLLENLGEDRGYKIIYSKNLRGLNCVIETYDICTRIKAKGFDGITLPEKYIESPLINNYPNPVTRVFEFEDIKINLEPEGDEELVTQELAFTRLREAAKNKFNVENVDKPLISIEVEFEELSTIEEYKKYKILETLFLGDYVTVIVPDMNNFEVKKRVIGIEYDPLNEKIIKLTIGDNIENFIESVNSSVEKVQNKVEKLPENLKETTVNYVSDLLINALGGYVTKTRSELYITDNENLNAALNCWRWNINGLGFSKTGVNGKYETAITGDGRIIADFITAGTMNIDRITGLASELSNLHSTIEINNENITAIISKSGGSNLLENSSGQFGNKKWYDVVTNEAAKIQAFTDTAIKNTFVAQSAFKMQSETAQQIIHVVNGEYNLSFKYKKLLELAVCKIIINAKEILLDKLDYTEVDTTILVSTNSIAVQLVSDTNNACLIGDLMLIAGTSKQVYSINENESITTTVKISDSIEVNSSSSETSANFDNDGIRIKNANNKNVVAEFTKEGTNTAKITADNCFIAGILGQIVAGQGWFS